MFPYQFPLPVLTKSSPDGVLEFTLLSANRLVDDHNLLLFINDIIKREWIQIVLRKDNFNEIEGDAWYN